MTLHPFEPPDSPRRSFAVLATSLGTACMVIGVVVVLVLSRPASLSAMSLPPAAPPIEVKTPEWVAKDYAVTDLSARWLRQEGQDSDAYDVYEIKGKLRRRSPELSDSAQLTITLRLGGFNAGFTSDVVRHVPSEGSQSFSIQIQEGTLAKMRGTDVRFFLSVEPAH